VPPLVPPPVAPRPSAAHPGRGRAVRGAAAGPGASGGAGRRELAKNFEPAKEEEIYAWWEGQGMFSPDHPDNAARHAGDPFVISMPPPNVTGKLHMGHAMFVTLQDIMTRFQRMRGRPTLWLPGTDHAGIATQMVVEKSLAAQGQDRKEMGREAFVGKVWEWKREYGGFITSQLRRLGASCDWERERFTLDDKLSDAVAEAFVRLHDKGLVYRGTYMVNWSPSLQTAVSDIEVEFSEEQGKLYYFKYPVEGGEEHLPVATTRPETILGDTAVAVNPEDERYRHLVGKRCVVPMSGGRTVPIIADDYVDMEFGTGALKITPGHDPNDWEIGKRVGLEVINIMNKDASMNDKAGKYNGLDRFECRKQLWSDMEAEGLVLRVEDYTNRVPRSQRGGEIIEPLASEQWFVKMGPLAAPALDAVKSGDLRIQPQRFEVIYNGWLEGIKDWCVSRQLWWGHRIPVWYVHDSEEAAAEAVRANQGRGEAYVVARNEAEARERAGPGKVLVQEEDVLDTWFSSGLWPFSTVGWPDEASSDYQRFYPSAVMETGHDILFFWVARMVMMGIEFTGKVPFHTVFLHGLVRDEKGRKMSKSLGNVVDPVDTIAEYGTDALRYTLATGTAAGQDINLSLDRVNANRNFTNKIWNVGKFVEFSLRELSDDEYAALGRRAATVPDRLAELPLAERWAVSCTHALVDKVTGRLEALEMAEAGRLIYDFFWSDFADWYVESAKDRLYGGDEGGRAAALETAAYCYDVLLRVMHPVMPYLTEELWQAMPTAAGLAGKSLMTQAWPGVGLPRDEEAERTYGVLQSVVRSVRNARAEYGVELGKKVPASVCVADGDLRASLAEELSLIALLAKLDAGASSVGALEEGAAAAEGSVELVVAPGVQVVLPMSGLFDAAKEIERLQGQRAKLDKDAAGLRGRLSNPKFVDKAPQKVVDEAKGQLAELEGKMAAIDEKIEAMLQMAP